MIIKVKLSSGKEIELSVEDIKELKAFLEQFNKDTYIPYYPTYPVVQPWISSPITYPGITVTYSTDNTN